MLPEWRFSLNTLCFKVGMKKVAVDDLIAIHQKFLVEADGIEPTTSCLQSTRSPS